MATMFPAEVESFTTHGEKKVYEFLRRAARPDGAFLVWYSPDIEDREPDFILYSPDSGLIVLEVKDWTPAQVLEADPKSALLRIGGREERRKQPLAQAREYVNALMAMLGKKARANHPLPCPVTWGAIFPHMRREEFRQCGLASVMEERRVLCWDDISDGSPLERDVSGQTFRKWMLERFPPLFPFSMTASQLNWLRACIFPVVRIDLPQRGLSRQAQNILAMDHDQENLARTFGKGRLLISGPAGSGKTLILAHQAWYLPRVDRSARHILIACFNLSLVGYIRRLLAKKGVCLGPKGVEVLPFYSICERILGEKLGQSGEESAYYELVVNECLERLKAGHALKGHWDAIFVDEGQDFSAPMAQVLLKLLPPHGALTICEDDNQRLYNDGDSIWKKLGIEGLKCQSLNCQYRNSAPIAFLATRALGNMPERPSSIGCGEEPRILQSDNSSALIEAVADAIASLAADGVQLNEIAALYARGNLPGGENLPEALIAALEARGILARWVARDAASKLDYDISTDSVTISTIHSAKGLDYAHVFLLGLDSLKPESVHDRRLAHVGITRAREGLTLCILSRTGLAEELCAVLK